MPPRIIVRSSSSFVLALLFLSVAAAEDEIAVDREADGVVVRSPISQGNFLFRAPPAFRRAEAPEGFAVALEAEGASIRLRLGKPGPSGLAMFLDRHAAEYGSGLKAKPERKVDGGRCLVRLKGEQGVRLVLVVLDGTRSYELFLEASPPDGELAGKLEGIAAGFTILSPKGPPAAVTAGGPLAEPETIEHDYYRLVVFKPEGFVRKAVDPDRDEGIFLHLQRLDEEKNLCDVFVRVHLAKAMKTSIEDKAQAAIDRFVSKYPDATTPSKPRRSGWPGANNAYKLKLVGKSRKGFVVEEEWRFIDHSNGRAYEIQLAKYGAAGRAFRKEIRRFWRKLRIIHK